MPTHDEVTERCHARMLVKLAERVHCQEIGRTQWNLDPLVL